MRVGSDVSQGFPERSPRTELPSFNVAGVAQERQNPGPHKGFLRVLLGCRVYYGSVL